MRALACTLLVLAACGDDNPSTPKDAAPGDATRDAASSDAGTCATKPLPACAAPVAGTTVTLRELPRVPGSAIIVTAPPNDPRLFVVEQSGLVYIYEDEQRLAEPFLDLSESIRSGGEQGLLGLAFHPDYACNGQFFVYYTTSNANVVARCTVSSDDPNRANPTCTPILSIPDFASNHNGGMMEFGPDGYLYIGTGDGGGGGDPRRNGQSLVDGDTRPDSIALLGKMLRIDVDTTSPDKAYGIPPTNPFASGGGAPEIFLIGLRNPWRWSFDKQTGDLWIGDVGQDAFEELTVLRAGDQAGKNLGWSIYEGRSCYRPPCDDATAAMMTMPQEVYGHGSGWLSIIAGEVYRGTCYPDLVGWHFYTDYNSSQVGLRRARLLPDDTLETERLSVTMPGNVSSIHADARGEIYLTTTGGRLYHLEVAP